MNVPTLDRLIIIGAGAVGGSIGGLLAEAGHEVVLVARGAHHDALAADGLALRLPSRALHLRLPCVNSLEDVDWRDGDVAMLATKLQDAESVLDALRVAAGAHVPVVCAVNGLEGEQWAAARFETVLSMLVWLPATHLVPGEVRLHSDACPGVLDTGPFQGTDAMSLASQLCANLRDAGFDAIAREDITRWKYAKLITNLGSAAQAMVEDDWKTVADAARTEGETVLAAAKVDRVSTEALLDRCRAVTVEAVDGHARAGGSTWQSRARGKSLESPWIEGLIARLATQHGITAPINTYLAAASREPRALTAAEVMGT